MRKHIIVFVVVFWQMKVDFDLVSCKWFRGFNDTICLFTQLSKWIYRKSFAYAVTFLLINLIFIIIISLYSSSELKRCISIIWQKSSLLVRNRTEPRRIWSLLISIKQKSQSPLDVKDIISSISLSCHWECCLSFLDT